MSKYIDKSRNIEIFAEELILGKDIILENNISIKTKGIFKLGDYGHLGSNTNIRGRNIIIGNNFYNSSDLTIGGGGSMNPTANLIIGDRCVMHNNHLNIAAPITIGNDVAFSPDTKFITHGFWQSILEGYPSKLEAITINDGVIIGQGSIVLMGITIAPNIVIGAGSVITHDLVQSKSIYAGNPARFIRVIVSLPEEEQIKILSRIVENYVNISTYHGISPKISIAYPYIYVNEFTINIETKDYFGTECKETDDFRDYLRKWGIKIYTERPFKSYFTF